MRDIRALFRLGINVLKHAGGTGTSWMKRKWDARPKGFEKIPIWLLAFIFFGSSASAFYWLKVAEDAFMPLAHFTDTHDVTFQMLLVWGIVGLLGFQGLFFKGLAWHSGRIFWKRVWG